MEFSFKRDFTLVFIYIGYGGINGISI